MRLSKLLFSSFLVIIMQILIVEDMTGHNHGGTDNLIKIGLLIQNNQLQAARQGTELAIKNANEKGGFKGRKFKVVVRSMEGSWGTGSKEAVKLIFDEEVYAIIGSHDGRNAHLVEQVTAKAHLTFLSAWASDPTLSQAFVPWFLNCVPNDLQQASSLIEEIYHKRRIAKVALVCDNSYDSNIAAKSFLKVTKSKGITEPIQFSSENSEKDLIGVLDKINKGDAESIVLLGQPDFSWKFIQLMRLKKMKLTVFSSLFSLGEKGSLDTELVHNAKIIKVSSGFYLRSDGKAFQKEYESVYGDKPTEVAAYAFDATNLIIEAIRNADADRSKIQSELAKIHYEGVTGLIQFDDKGNRLGAPELRITN
jgi:branched-chain amino acid transport system substrate-binding protein